MNLRKIFLMALVLAAAVLYILYVENPQREREEKAGKLFMEVNPENFKRISLSKNDESITLENQKPAQSVRDNIEKLEAGEKTISDEEIRSWQLNGLKDIPVDKVALNSLITSLISLDLGKEIPAEEVGINLAVFGLEKPELVIETETDKSVFKLEFGNKNEYVNKRYLRVSGRNSLYLVPETTFSNVNKDQSQFRKKNIIEFSDLSVASVKIDLQGKPSIVLKREKEEPWQIIEPIKVSGGRESIQSFLRDLRSIQADEFIDKDLDSLEKYGLKTPEVKVTLDFNEDAKREPLILVLSKTKEKEGFYYKVDDISTVGRSKQPTLEKLKKAPEDFRNRKPFDFSPFLVNEIEILRPGEEAIVAKKTGENWMLGEKAGDEVFIQQFLNDLSSLNVKDFIEQKDEKVFSSPILSIKLNVEALGDTKASTQTLVIGGKSGNDYLSRANNVNELFTISPENYQKLNPKREVLEKVEATPTAVPEPTK